MEIRKMTVKVEVDTSEVDKALKKINEETQKANELKELLNGLAYVNHITYVEPIFLKKKFRIPGIIA